MSLSTRRIVAVGAVSIFALGAVQTLVDSPAGAAPAATTTTYVTAKNLCAAPKAGHASCYAMKRVVTKKGAAGARAMATPGYATGPAGGFTPADLASAYAVSPSTSTTQTIGIVDAFDDPNALNDLNTFNAKYGLPAETSSTFKKVSQTGSTTSLPAADAGWAGEISLDLDAVRGLCNKCKIILVEATTNSFADLGTAENEAVALGATIVSNSYGGAESGAPSSTMLNAYKHSGVVILASTADHGMFDWDGYNAGGSSSNAPAEPASFNTVVAVGGTTLYLNDDGTRAGESVWNENGSSDVTGGNLGNSMGASGGGCSTQISAQGWQSHVANWSLTTCGSKRMTGDIAALADPYTGYDIYDSYQSSGWQTFGGTSLASPLVAAMWGLAGGSGGVTYPALSLYGHFKSDTTRSLYDVVTGGNGFCDGTSAGSCAGYWGSVPNTFGAGILDCAWKGTTTTLNTGTRECDAATGYDGPSGVGTPLGLNAFKAMGPTAKVTVPSTVTHGTSASFSGSTSTDPFPGGTLTSFAWTWGDGTTSTTTTPTASHTYSSAGTKSLTLKVTDNYGRTGSVTVSVTVH